MGSGTRGIVVVQEKAFKSLRKIIVVLLEMKERIAANLGKQNKQNFLVSW